MCKRSRLAPNDKLYHLNQFVSFSLIFLTGCSSTRIKTLTLPLITVYHHLAFTELNSSYYLLTVFKQYQKLDNFFFSTLFLWFQESNTVEASKHRTLPTTKLNSLAVISQTKALMRLYQILPQLYTLKCLNLEVTLQVQLRVNGKIQT